MQTVLIVASVLYYTYPYLKTRKLLLDRTSILLLRAVPIIYVLMFVAFISNVFGYTNLTELVLTTVIEGTAIITLIYGIKTILGGLTNAFINYYLSKLPRLDPEYKLVVLSRTFSVVKIFAGIFLLSYFLQSIDFYDIIIEKVLDFLHSPWQIGELTFRLGNIIDFFIILFVSFSITRFIANVVDGGALDFMDLPKGVPHIISVVTRYFLIGFGLIIAISSIGINLSQFNLMAGALGLGIGFGLQNIISNFISGLILIFERPIQNNDVVEVGAILGTVKKIGVRSSNVRTFDGAEVVVPNSQLISNEVINWTLSDAVKRLEILIGVAYGTDLQTVINILQNVAESCPSALQEPKPLSLFDSFGDSSLNFRLLVWVPVDTYLIAKSEISLAVYNRFKKEKIEIPFPQRDLHIKSDDRSVGKKD